SMGVGSDVAVTANYINWTVQNPSRTVLPDTRLLRYGVGNTIYPLFYSDAATKIADGSSEVLIEWVEA
ncbi:MAG: hypothetical protein ACRYHQ_23200, partial [Janthinobacterium lividum]